MCGICGFVGTSAQSGDPGLIDRARDTLIHRGPDDSGSWASPNGQVALAMRRLAIVDLSPAGHQPMCGPSAAPSTTLVFNGEIYNHNELRRELADHGYEFRGRSDTEVVLAAYLQWGTECLSRFVGMFALALYDARTDELFLARDRAGERPLFYTHVSGRLSFASELKALMEDVRVPRRLDVTGLNHYLAFGNGPPDSSLLAGVRKLPPAHALVYQVKSDRLRIWQYWSVPSFAPRPNQSGDTLCDELEELLSHSVRAQLQADVPVAVMLSGGIDSSIVTALAARESNTVRTFTVTMPTKDHFNEGPHAKLVASHFGTRHTELQAEPASVDLLPALARQFDDPIADSSMVPTYQLSQVIRPHAKVALGGDGADELFGGYPHHRWALQHHTLRRLSAGGIEAVAAAALPLFPLGFRGRNYVATLARDTTMATAHINQYFDAGWRRYLSPMLRDLSDEALGRPELHRSMLSMASASPLQRITAVDFLNYLPDDILVKIDRASMLASLEVRAPWLDHRIIEFAFSRVPDRLRATARHGKILPRLLASRVLPPALVQRRKQGFSIPLHAWFKGEWGAYMASVIAEAPPELIDPAAVATLLRNQRRGLANTQRLFALTMLELWRREYKVSLPA